MQGLPQSHHPPNVEPRSHGPYLWVISKKYRKLVWLQTHQPWKAIHNLQPNQKQATKCWMTKCTNLKLSSTLSSIVPVTPPYHHHHHHHHHLNRNVTPVVLSAIYLPTQMRTNQCLNWMTCSFWNKTIISCLYKVDASANMKLNLGEKLNFPWKDGHTSITQTLIKILYFSHVTSGHIWN